MLWQFGRTLQDRPPDLVKQTAAWRAAQAAQAAAVPAPPLPAAATTISCVGPAPPPRTQPGGPAGGCPAGRAGCAGAGPRTCRRQAARSPARALTSSQGSAGWWWPRAGGWASGWEAGSCLLGSPLPALFCAERSWLGTLAIAAIQIGSACTGRPVVKVHKTQGPTPGVAPLCLSIGQVRALESSNQFCWESCRVA